MLVLHFFSPTLQGYYYSFNSLLGFQVYLDLGLGQALLNFSSHEWSGLSWSPQTGWAGPEKAQQRLSALLRLCVRWSCVCAFCFFLFLSVAGPGVMGANSSLDWKPVWACLTVLAALRLALAVPLSFFEGCGRVREVLQVRIAEAGAIAMAAWAAILLGWGLWVCVAMAGASCLVTGGYLLWNRPFWMAVASRPPGYLSWRQEFWPVQWRFAASWLAGGLIFSLFIPAIMKVKGPVFAGRFGLSWTLIMGVTQLASAWAAPQAASLASLAARREWSQLNARFHQIWPRTALTNLLGLSAVVVLPWILARVGLVAKAQRLLTPQDCLPFALMIFVNQLCVPMGLYLRAHRKEPLTGVSTGLGLTSAFLCAWVTPLWGVSGLGWACLVLHVLGAQTCWIIFQTCRREWHRDDKEGP